MGCPFVDSIAVNQMQQIEERLPDRQGDKQLLTTESIWLYLAMSLCSVLSMIMATIPDRNNTITSEFIMLSTQREKKSTELISLYQQCQCQWKYLWTDTDIFFITKWHKWSNHPLNIMKEILILSTYNDMSVDVSLNFRLGPVFN